MKFNNISVFNFFSDCTTVAIVTLRGALTDLIKSTQSVCPESYVYEPARQFVHLLCLFELENVPGKHNKQFCFPS